MIVEQIIPENKQFNVADSALWSNSFVLQVHDNRTIEFLNALSKNIFSDPMLKTHAQFVALAFWLRKSNIQKLIERSGTKNSEEVYYSPIGIIFHVCPSNVDTMFVYSLAISLLMGNKNILRISKRNEIGVISNLFRVFNKTLSDDNFKVFNEYISVVSYGHEVEINNFLSQQADARIIWGGDKTIETFKQFKTKPRTKDVVFADRISCSIISTEQFLKLSEFEKLELTKKFFNDTYVFDQKGCSSPQAIFMYGKEEFNTEFKKEFANFLNQITNSQYEFDSFSIASLKMNNAVADIAEGIISDVKWENSSLWLSELSLNQVDIPHSCGAGYFYLIPITEIKEIKKYINKKFQTLTYFGLEKSSLEEIILHSNAIGVDRIVPVGTALDFDFMWDGYNLFEELSNKKVLKH